MIRLRDIALTITSAVFALVMLFVLAALEYGLPIYVPPWVYGLIFAFTYALLLGLMQEYHAVVRCCVPLLFTVGAGLLFWSAEDSSQSFMRALHRVQPGMSIEQVEGIMGSYNRYNALFGIRNTKRLPSGQMVLIEPAYACYKHATPEDGAYNAALGVVNFKDGKATSVEYQGD